MNELKPVPKWKLAQPFRYIAHNGEINTIRGNVNWMKSKQADFMSEVFTHEEFELLLPICDKAHSDSANLDSIVEMLTLAGRSLPHAMMMVIPEAWQENHLMAKSKRAFYEYHASLMEPWDGPASISFTDGNIIGATLDRNGLRPSRYLVTEDDIVIMASEAGALPVEESKVVMKGRLQPGKMFVVDLEQGRIISDEELKQDLAEQHPFAEWLKEGKVLLQEIPEGKEDSFIKENDLFHYQIAFGYSREDLKTIIGPMANSGTEPIGSMGSDIPLPPLSKHSQHLSNYFKQLFAQVSNPPIDPIREKLVMSLYSNLGSNLNTLEATAEHCKHIALAQPVLNSEDLSRLKNLVNEDYKTTKIETLFNSGRPESLAVAIDSICTEALQAVRNGSNILLLSDRNLSKQKIPIPSLLVLGAIHQTLVANNLRAISSLIVESGDVRETHHFATLIGFGANAICPYLAFDTIAGLHEKGLLEENLTLEQANSNFVSGIGYGLRKIFSKMGISTLQSYQGAQIFEILGLNEEVVDKCFTKTVSRIEGIGFKGIEQQMLWRHIQAYPEQGAEQDVLSEGGIYEWRKQGEAHLFDPETIHLLQKSTRNNDYKTYKEYASHVNEQAEKPFTLRGLLDFKKREPVPISEVEPAENIFHRFATGAMSFGSISYEAHSTLAIAMNLGVNQIVVRVEKMRTDLKKRPMAIGKDLLLNK